MAVYFAKAGDTAAVKIGFAKDPVSRIRDMQISIPDILVPIRIIQNGTKQTERALHCHYLEFHIRGEWFRFHESMLTIDPFNDLSSNDPPSMRKTPHSFFWQWRNEQGLTLTDAATVLGYSVRRMKDYDYGHKEPDKAMRLAMLAIAAGVKLDEDETKSPAAA